MSGRGPLFALALCLSAACITGDDPGPSLGTSSDEAAALWPPGTMFMRLVPRITSWHFNSEGIDFGALGPAWRTSDQGPTWRIGDAPLGYGESYIATRAMMSSGGNPLTIYARREFSVPETATVRKLYLRVRYDDGFVFYLNGKEGGRAHMPSGTVRYTTLATAIREAGSTYTTYDISSQIPNLVPGGLNNLAIEVHQAGAGSSDLVLEAELIAWVDRPAALPTQSWIARSNQWTFWDRGGDLGTAWREPSFDDGAWSVGEGPLGYGEPYIETDLATGSITTYFRTRFLVDEAERGLVAEVRYDDGFVMYLNGHEIARRAMPTGAVTAATLSTGHEATTYEEIDLDAALPYLQAGDNVLAVEVHQASSSSSDLVFDMSLRDRDNWFPQRSGTGDALNAIDCSTPQHCWAVGDDGTVRRTSDSGNTWRAQDLGVRIDYRAIDVIDGGYGVIVGDGGTVMWSEDGGNSWTRRGPDTSDSLIDVQYVSSDHAYVLSNGHLWATYNAGDDWTQLPPLPAGTWYGFKFDVATGWLVGSEPSGDGDSWAAIYKTTDGGATWNRVWSAGQHFAYLFGVEIATPGHTPWAYGESSLSGHGELKLVSRDGGATWTEAPETTNEAGMFDMDWNGLDLGWGVGYGGSIVHTADGGYTWTVQQEGEGTGGVTLDGVDCQGGFVCFAVGEAGTILSTRTWGD